MAAFREAGQDKLVRSGEAILEVAPKLNSITELPVGVALIDKGNLEEARSGHRDPPQLVAGQVSTVQAQNYLRCAAQQVDSIVVKHQSGSHTTTVLKEVTEHICRAEVVRRLADHVADLCVDLGARLQECTVVFVEVDSCVEVLASVSGRSAKDSALTDSEDRSASFLILISGLESMAVDLSTQLQGKSGERALFGCCLYRQ